jgi:hypothetical protein
MMHLFHVQHVQILQLLLIHERREVSCERLPQRDAACPTFISRLTNETCFTWHGNQHTMADENTHPLQETLFQQQLA